MGYGSFTRKLLIQMVGGGGLEPPTNGLKERWSGGVLMVINKL
jgi:hypothetical protein